MKVIRVKDIVHLARTHAGKLLVFDDDGVILLPPLQNLFGLNVSVLPHGGKILLKAPDTRDLIDGEHSEVTLSDKQIRTILALQNWEIY